MYKLIALDMDGTIYLGNELIDGAKEFLEKLKEKNIKYIFLTNNSSKNKDKYVEKLNKLGIEAHREDVFSSGEATTIYLSKKKKGAKVFLLGTKDLEDEFEKAGFELVRERNKDIEQGKIDKFLFSYIQFHSVLLALAVFVLVKEVGKSVTSIKISNFLAVLSSCSLGIYLIHKLVMSYELKFLFHKTLLKEKRLYIIIQFHNFYNDTCFTYIKIHVSLI